MSKKTDLTKYEYPSIAESFEEGRRPAKKKDHQIGMGFVEFAKSEPVNDKEPTTLEKSILRSLNGPMESVERLAFEVNPNNQLNQGGWKPKRYGIPDVVLKRIAIQDDLVASIVNARSNQVGAFGLPRYDRYSMGYVIEPNVGVIERMTKEQKAEFDKRIESAVRRIATCGDEPATMNRRERCTFRQWLMMSAKNAVTVGRIATELVWGMDSNGEERFSRFRVLDAGTIMQANPQFSDQESVRQNAVRQLARLKDKTMKLSGEKDAEYTWAQVVEGQALNYFTDKQCVVHNFYPVADIELDGYPVTPIDTMISAVTTHINIGTHNKMYFLSGRATRGMLVINSDDVDEAAMGRIKQQFNASINGVDRSWRMPVFSVGKDDQITWSSIDNSSRDAEFQYLTDMNARVILSAFQMAPEELPGWAYLSRGSNNQTLAECLDGSVRIVTNDGLLSLERILANRKEANTVIWSGTKWTEGRVFRSGKKKLRATELDCGVTLKTSPDHRFRVIGDCGEPVWKRQEELQIDDYVLLNKKPVKGDDSLVPFYKGKKLTLDMMEILGWFTGDGTLVANRERVGAQFMLFYHPTKERDVWKNHDSILSEFGLKNHSDEVFLSEEQREETKARYGFDTVSESRIRNTVYDTDFYRWMKEIGFNTSSEKKCIPAILHVLPEEYRRAFLRGFFSADGGKLNSRGRVALTVQNSQVRDQTRQLLLGLGIRTSSCKGLMRESVFSKNEDSKSFSFKLFIKDRAQFWNQIGFIQPHKQQHGSAESWQIGNPPRSVLERYLGSCVKTEAFLSLPKKQRDNVHSVLRADGKRNCTWGFLISTLEASKLPIPQWLEDFHPEPVRVLTDLGCDVEMFDVEMFDVEMFDVDHGFVADGVLVHNSNKEFQIEAARDLGIRPLIGQFEDFLNATILPLIDEGLSKICKLRLMGLDAETAEKESVRLQQDMPVHMTFNNVLQKVEKDQLPKCMGGDYPLNPQFQAVLDKVMTLGQQIAYFLGKPEAATDPTLNFYMNPAWLQYQQFLQQGQMMQQQAQQQQVAQAQGNAGQSDPNQEGVNDTEAPQNDAQPKPANPQAQDDLTRSVDQAISALTKGEAQLPMSKRRLLAHQKLTIKQGLDGIEDDIKNATKEVLDVVEKHVPKKSKK